MSTFHFRGSMTPADLIAWRQRLALTQAKAASELGCSRRSMQIWELGHRPVPKYIALACAAVAHGLPALGKQEETRC